ncbi:hypothetical protein PtrSN002B_007587 [Pyrenophora tritici-repentis]|uniref:LysM domain containing protein n=2 Tax=Pyrenophora tritici-repentis TaxID=45151 RepID=A0A2W1E062_9PLEO|nr:uncharacterized protein PTRG_01191 [Pyrenophora tritici-repentis Pt-1C-BFP]KAA8625826.1 LysM domain-containing protein [Pyrenophora tritici-repentis]EDU40629.1 predicted protein [Pyrenophora tritici-repentis Pt-1C-BFP]KAF7454244.1 LysM domain containing protein [Pyrenophora tritici-repentis]KAF7577341.1 LysM domain containing protein [Pyrenophora tritici-repentis]KAG9387991.1 LysM domain containing protein [Pyrenophora tritici-repentis]
MRTTAVLLLATLLSVTEAARRQCAPTKGRPNYGYYPLKAADNIEAVKLDFCAVGTNNIARLNPRLKYPFKAGDYLVVPCKPAKRDCRGGANGIGSYHIVEGDELNPIARDFCTTAERLVQMNPEKIKNKDFIPADVTINVPCAFH